MNITGNVEMLEVTADLMGETQTIYPSLLRDDKQAVLIDTGYPGQWPLIKGAFTDLGIPLSSLTAIIITHQDLDHIGGLPTILSEATHTISVFASSMEAPFIRGEKRLLKLTPRAIEEAMKTIPESVSPQWRTAFRHVLEHPPQGRVDQLLRGGETLACSGGIVVIDTPGHTPGHISLYHPFSKTLIAGDAMVVRDGELFGPDPAQTLDLKTARGSLSALLHYDIETVICYHGGLYKGNVNQRILELL